MIMTMKMRYNMIRCAERIKYENNIKNNENNILYNYNYYNLINPNNMGDL